MKQTFLHLQPGVEITGALLPGFEAILNPEALKFLVELERRFGDSRLHLLDARAKRQQEFDNGALPNFIESTTHIRSEDWKVAPTPADLQDRRVEITGPVDRKMIINALNSGAKVFMADLEDSNSPTWENVVQGQINLRDAVERSIEFTATTGKHYSLRDEIATLIVRPRGLHLPENHMTVDGRSISAGLFDFGLFFFHNAKELIERGSGPYFYIPKLESHLEARFWNDVFIFSQESLEIPRGTIKATVLIETITAAFEMDEILYELREHSSGLNCGRWDYIFSVIKKFHRDPGSVLPDRALVTMTSHFLRSYSQLLIKTCHSRGAHAIGGMAAQIPIKNDEKKNAEALRKVVEDKEREVNDGHDGSWVAHPGLVPVVLEIFNKRMKGANQVDRKRDDIQITVRDLLTLPSADNRITESGLRTNLRVSVEYLAWWLTGQGCVPINHLMEDAATAEISRAQVWQWIHHRGGKLDDGRDVTLELTRELMKEEVQKLEETLGKDMITHVRNAAKTINDLIGRDDFVDFLTLPALEQMENTVSGGDEQRG